MVDIRQQRLFGMDEEMIKEMADDAMKRVTEFINRSAGQHIRALRETHGGVDPHSSATVHGKKVLA